MSFKADFEDFHFAGKSLIAYFSENNTLVKNLNINCIDLINPAVMIGDSAEAISNYFNRTHGEILEAINDILVLHQANYCTYANDIEACDNNDMAVLPESEMAEYQSTYNKDRSGVEEITERASSVANSVSDIASIHKPDWFELSEAYTRIIKQLKDLREKVSEVESKHSNSDFVETSDAIKNTKDLIKELSEKDKTFKANFTIANCVAEISSFKKFELSTVTMTNHIETNRDKLSKQIEKQFDHIQEVQEGIETRHTWLKVGAVVVLAVASAAVIFFTAGTATPAVAAGITAGVSGVSGLIQGATFSYLDQYADDGQIEIGELMLDSGITGVESAVGGYFGSYISNCTTVLTSAASTSFGQKLFINMTGEVVESFISGTVNRGLDAVGEGIKTDNLRFSTVLEDMFDPNEIGKDAASSSVSSVFGTGMNEIKNIKKIKNSKLGEALDSTKTSKRVISNSLYKGTQKVVEGTAGDFVEGTWDEMKESGDIVKSLSAGGKKAIDASSRVEDFGVGVSKETAKQLSQHKVKTQEYNKLKKEGKIPETAPQNIQKFRKDGGKVTINRKGEITYTNANGDSLKYNTNGKINYDSNKTFVDHNVDSVGKYNNFIKGY